MANFLTRYEGKADDDPISSIKEILARLVIIEALINKIRNGLSSISVPVPIVFGNPGLTYGSGVLIQNSPSPWVVAVPASSELSLIHLVTHNTGPATGQLNNIKIEVDTDVVDTGAGVVVINTGKSDAIYLGVAGKTGNPAGNNPTGVGIDLNKQTSSSSEQASANSSQQGIQIFDWSTTNQGVGGPRGMIIQKLGNLNTDHLLMTLRSNRNHLQLVVKSGDAGYNGNYSALRFDDETSGVTWWQILANGIQLFNKDGIGIQWVVSGHNNAYVAISSSELKIRGGGGGIRLVNNADTNTALLLQDNCDVVTGLAVATGATAGFLHIPSPAGAPTGVPTTYTGWTPIAYDRTNNFLYAYNGGWKKILLA